MTDHDKNMRTLIVSFVVALMVMVPLRFVEATAQTLEATNRVLGEMTVATPVQKIQRETVPIVQSDAVLEAPYNKIEATKVNCISPEQAANQVKLVIKKVGGDLNKLNETQSAALYAAIEKIDKTTCN